MTPSRALSRFAFPIAAVILASLAAALAPPSAGAQASRETSARFQAIDAFVATVMAEDRIPGVAVVIVRGDSVLHLRGYGVAGNGRPVTAQTSFVLGSMSKPFTALAVMQLVQSGRIDLDAPVQRYLPSFRVRDERASALISVRHLLQHTSGIPTNAPRATGDSLTLDAQVRALKDVKLLHQPGESHEYSSPNYVVLGAVVEAVTGRPFDTYVRDSIFTPLRMVHSFTDQSRALADGMALGHRYVFGHPVAATLPHEADRLPAAAIISSAEDLGHFLSANLSGGTFGERSVLSPAMLREMHTKGAPSDGFSYGLGWRIGAIGGVRAIHHGGIVPNFRGKMVLLPEHGWGVAVLTNASSGLPLPVTPSSHRMADAIAASLVGVPLDDSPSNHRMVNLLMLVVAVVLLFLQLRSVRLLLRETSTAAPNGGAERSGVNTRSTMVAIMFDVAWLLFGVLMLPRLIGLDWSGLFRAAPDAAWWLCAMLLTSGIALLLRLRSLQR